MTRAHGHNDQLLLLLLLLLLVLNSQFVVCIGLATFPNICLIKPLETATVRFYMFQTPSLTPVNIASCNRNVPGSIWYNGFFSRRSGTKYLYDAELLFCFCSVKPEVCLGCGLHYSLLCLNIIWNMIEIVCKTAPKLSPGNSASVAFH